MTASRLAALLDQAKRDQSRAWESFWMNDSEAHIATLAPDMARLLVDMADHLAATRNWVCANMGNPDDMDALLARFAALDEKAGAA